MVCFCGSSHCLRCQATAAVLAAEEEKRKQAAVARVAAKEAERREAGRAKAAAVEAAAKAAAAEESKKREAERAKVPSSEQALAAGNVVTVILAFESDDNVECRKTLHTGDRGVVEMLDEDGDADISFDSDKQFGHWVRKKNFFKLRVEVPSSEQELAAGNVVTVISRFETDNLYTGNTRTVHTGERGVVAGLDEDGDAYISFGPEKDWVLKKNFCKLHVEAAKAKEEKKEEPQTVPSPTVTLSLKEEIQAERLRSERLRNMPQDWGPSSDRPLSLEEEKEADRLRCEHLRNMPQAVPSSDRTLSLKEEKEADRLRSEILRTMARSFSSS